MWMPIFNSYIVNKAYREDYYSIDSIDVNCMLIQRKTDKQKDQNKYTTDVFPLLLHLFWGIFLSLGLIYERRKIYNNDVNETNDSSGCVARTRIWIQLLLLFVYRIWDSLSTVLLLFHKHSV